eukprot:1889392-Rhodomonas_salina.1
MHSPLLDRLGEERNGQAVEERMLLALDVQQADGEQQSVQLEIPFQYQEKWGEWADHQLQGAVGGHAGQNKGGRRLH